VGCRQWPACAACGLACAAVPVLASGLLAESTWPSARCPVLAGRGRPGGGFAGRGLRLGETADSRLEVAFGVDQEVGGDHHLLASAHPFAYLDLVIAAGPELHFARLEATLSELHQNDLARAAVDHRRDRHGQHLAPGGHRQLDLGEHAGFEQHSRIAQFDADRNAAGFRLERRIDVADGPLENLLRVGVDLDPGRRTGFYHPDVLLEDVGDHPDRRQIGHLIERFTRHETHALHGLLLGHDAGNRRAEAERAPGVSGTGQGLELLVGDVPVFQAREARRSQLLHAAAGFAAGRVQRFRRMRGEHVFALGRDQFRAVDFKQHLALADHLTGHIDLQALDVALELGGDRILAAFVGLDATDRTNDPVERAQADGLGSDAELLNLFGADPELLRCARPLVGFVRIDRNVVHSHGVFLRCRRGVGQAHGVAVIENPALFRRRPAGSGGSLVSCFRMAGGIPLAGPIARGGCQRGDRQSSGCNARALLHRSSPRRRSISARRACPSACALIWSCLACRICRCASSSIAKSSLPFS
jgi:hypothetical protein